MRLGGFRFQVALIIFVVVLGLGLGLQYFHQQSLVINPLVVELQNVPGVEKLNWEKPGFGKQSRMNLGLRFKAGTPLVQAFGQVSNILERNGGDFALFIEDSSNAVLRGIFQRIQIALEEAIATGEFTLLEHRVKALAEEHGVTWDLALDRDYVYISLQMGENALHRVINRGVSEGQIVIFAERSGLKWVNG